MNDLRTDIKAGLKDKPLVDILKAMGYQKPSEQTIERLETVLSSDTLGLAHGGFDLRYSTPEFLVALCKVAGIDEQEARQRVRHLHNGISEDWHAFKPYLWVNTHFKRSSQPIFALAAMEGRRYLSFPEGFWRLPIAEQLGEAQRKVHAHMADTEGTLPMWGDIHEYWFFYEPEKAYVLSTRGDVLGKREGAVPNRAESSIAQAVKASDVNNA